MALLNPGEPMSGNVELDRLRKENAALRYRLEQIQHKVHHMMRWTLNWEQMDKCRDGDYLEYDKVVTMVRHWTDLSKEVKVP